MSKDYTIAKAKKVEVKVCKALNEASRGFEYTLHPNKYSHFDIYGIGPDKSYEIVEVKQRKHNPRWQTWFIEVKKIQEMFDEKLKALNNNCTMKAYLAVVSDGKICLYDINDIIEHPIKTIEMNETTARGFRNQGRKIAKEVYDFPKSLKHITL